MIIIFWLGLRNLLEHFRFNKRPVSTGDLVICKFFFVPACPKPVFIDGTYIFLHVKCLDLGRLCGKQSAGFGVRKVLILIVLGKRVEIDMLLQNISTEKY